MFGFNCDKSNLYKTSVKFQYILPRIVWKLLYFPLCTVDNLWFFPNPFTGRKIANRLLFQSTLKYLVEFFCFLRLSSLTRAVTYSAIRPQILRKKCLYLELFWSIFSHIRIEYGETLRSSPYSVRMREKTD